MVASEEKDLVKQTDFENLVLRAQEKKAEFLAKENRAQEIKELENKIEELKKDIIRQIASVYYFMRVEVELPPVGIGIEDFRVAKKKLTEIARKKVRLWLHRVFCQFINGACPWINFKVFGYFNQDSAPFKRTFKLPYEGIILSMVQNPGYKSAYNENMGDFIRKYNNAIPPNIVELFNKLFEEESKALKTQLCKLQGQN